MQRFHTYVGLVQLNEILVTNKTNALGLVVNQPWSGFSAVLTRSELVQN